MIAAAGYDCPAVEPLVSPRPALSPTRRRPLPQPRLPPPPREGGLLALLRFYRRHGMLTFNYLRLGARQLWLKARFRGRLVTDGPCFICPQVKLEIGKGAT